MTQEILCCPFCGGEASVTHKHYKGKLMRMAGLGYWGTTEDGRTLYWVGCHNSGCFQPKTYGDKEEAINMWNKRSKL